VPFRLQGRALAPIGRPGVAGRPQKAPQAIEKAEFAPGNGRPSSEPVDASDRHGRQRIESGDGHDDWIEGGEVECDSPGNGAAKA
jgi:hypothetical protein